MKALSLAIYRKGVEFADSKGIIIADTKFEFGLLGDELVLIDEVLTPDSSRFWPKATYKPGGSQESFDKQFVRDYLLSIQWNQKPPAPRLPDHVIEGTRKKYLEACSFLQAPVMLSTEQTVLLERIRLEDKTFQVTTESAIGTLAASIARLGVMHPPALLADDSGYGVVCGFRRIAACNLWVFPDFLSGCFCRVRIN